MTMVSALLVASLFALLGSIAIAVASAVAVRLRAAELATNAGPTAGEGPGVRLAGAASVTAHAAVLVGAAFLLVALAARVAATGHAPWSNLYETSIAFAFGLLAVYAGLERRLPIRGLAPGVAAIGAALTVFAMTQPDAVRPLVPALQAPLLLTIHVGAAMLAYAVSGVACAAAVGELIQRRFGDRVGALPSAATCRVAAHRAVLLGFPVLTAAIVLGSVWANLAWRSYWSNDPKELAAAATWLVYGAYLHVAGRRDRWSAIAPWLLVLGFVAVLFTYLGAGLFFVGEHSYAAA